MFEPILIFLIPIGMMIAGLAILWSQAGSRSAGRNASSDLLSNVVTAIGWVLLFVGLFAAVGLMTNVFCIPVWIVLIVVLLSLLFRYRSVERRSLLWTLMLAAEREIPLDTAARAFAEERHDAIGDRARDLAEYLEAGLPLALALKRAQLHFPQSVLLSAELGQQTGDLGGALRRSLGHSNESEIILRSAAERVFYLVCLVCFGLAMLTFMLVRIVPAFAKIFDEFAVNLPAATIWLVGTARFFAMFWPLIVLVGVVLLVLLVRSLSYYTGYSPRYLPGMTASWQRADRSVIMHWLAHAVRQDRPLPEMMRLISGYVTRNRLRRRLQQSAKRIDQGVEWTESLQEAGLIRQPEAAVFRSAERTGNLAWALEEMAESNVRRSVYQLRALTNVAFPAALLVLGGFVLVVACAMLTPLFDLIGWMT